MNTLKKSFEIYFKHYKRFIYFDKEEKKVIEELNELNELKKELIENNFTLDNKLYEDEIKLLKKQRYLQQSRYKFEKNLQNNVNDYLLFYRDYNNVLNDFKIDYNEFLGEYKKSVNIFEFLYCLYKNNYINIQTFFDISMYSSTYRKKISFDWHTLYHYFDNIQIRFNYNECSKLLDFFEKDYLNFPYLILDIETTGLSKNDKIKEISIINQKNNKIYSYKFNDNIIYKTNDYEKILKIEINKIKKIIDNQKIVVYDEMFIKKLFENNLQEDIFENSKIFCFKYLISRYNTYKYGESDFYKKIHHSHSYNQIRQDFDITYVSDFKSLQDCMTISLTLDMFKKKNIILLYDFFSD